MLAVRELERTNAVGSGAVALPPFPLLDTVFTLLMQGTRAPRVASKRTQRAVPGSMPKFPFVVTMGSLLTFPYVRRTTLWKDVTF